MDYDVHQSQIQDNMGIGNCPFVINTNGLRTVTYIESTCLLVLAPIDQDVVAGEISCT